MKKAHSVKKNSASGGISLALAFMTFILLTMGLTGLLICGLAGFTIDKEFSYVAKKDQQQRLEIIKSIIASYINDQYYILQDHASFPILIQTVMQPESYLDKVTNFMESLSFLGKQYQLVLLDCYGSVINSTMAQPHFDYMQQDWVLGSQIELNSYFCSISKQNETFYWRLATPVLYGGQTQGFLVAEIPLSTIYSTPQLGNILSNSQSQLEILYHGRCVSISGNTDGEVLESAIDDTGITLRYTSSMSEILAAKHAMIFGIVALFLTLITMTILVAVWIGRKLFVVPLESLRAMTSSLSHKEGNFASHRESKIRELNLLSTDFEIMEKKVRDREQQLQQINDELEFRILQRTEQLQNSNDSLVKATQQWRNTFDSAQDVILVYDENLIVVRANIFASLFWSQTFEDLIGKSHTQLFHQPSCLIDECHLGQVIKTKQHHETEIQFGDQWLLSSADPILDHGGNFCGVVHFVRNITERKKLARRLKENETNFRSFFDSVENLLSVMDMQGTIIEVNKSLWMRLGYSEKELVGRNILTLHPEEYQEPAKEIVQQMLDGRVKSCPLPLITKDGKYIPAETHVVHGIWSEQKVLFGVSKDISELKQSEEKFSKAFQSSAALMAISTVEDGKFIEVNDCFLKTLDYRREDAIGKTSKELGLFLDTQRRETFIQTIKKQGYIREFELEIKTRKGNVRHAIFSADVLQMQGIQYLLTVANDITDLRRSQVRLNNSEQRLRAVIETIPDLVWLKDAEGVYLSCNPKFERFFGAEAACIIGKTDYDFVDKNIADSYRHHDNLAMTSDEPVIYEEEIMYADDKHTELLETIKTPVRDSEGQLIGILGIARDITYRKQAEIALQRAHDTLETNVRQRTAQLRQSQHQLRELNCRLQSVQETYRKDISREIHDELGTVLTALKYDLAWIKRKLPDSSRVIDEKINTMSKTVDSVVETVQNICAQLRPGLLDDMGLAAAIEWQANKFAKMAGLACKTDLDENIDLDPDCSTVLFRIFQELMTNILRHAKADRVQIGLKQQGSTVFLEVQDNGIGVSREQILHPRSLGLIGMKERVIIYGGSFQIKGFPDKGSIAKVAMPSQKKDSTND